MIDLMLITPEKSTDYASQFAIIFRSLSRRKMQALPNYTTTIFFQGKASNLYHKKFKN